ncbi:hypothetical protein [Acidisphaera sp. L21]|uniref:hypothetical protein n=1 Tax=Acidisphaera sp. L21 TaxID=1641851 RepID=UPI001C208772|nr:hypothetical protein [Acidisphaera sp. L21]
MQSNSAAPVTEFDYGRMNNKALVPLAAVPCSTMIGAESQLIPDHPFEAADVGFDQGSPIVARGLLPSHSAAFGDDLQVTVS